MTKCPNCGADMSADDLFCGVCGTKVPIEPASPPVDDDHRAETIVGASGLPRLIASSGAGKGREFVLKGNVRLGRETDNDIVLIDPKISRHHAAFEVSGGDCVVADLGSTNGVYVNDLRIDSPYRLEAGDRIKVGDIEFIFSTGQLPAIPSRPVVSRPSSLPPISVAPSTASAPPPVAPRGVPGPSPSYARSTAGSGYAASFEEERGSTLWLWIGCLALVIIAVLIACGVIGALLYQGGYVQRYPGGMSLPSPAPTLPPSISEPSPTRPPPPTPAARSVELLFEDDFGDPTSGWGQVSNENEEKGYDNGQYSIAVKAINFFSFALAGQHFDDFILEVEASQVEGPDDNSYGVCVRYQEGGFYRFNVSGDSFYAVGKYTVEAEPGQEWADLTSWEKSSHINAGQSTNHLKVVGRGARFSFYVNGQHLIDVVDPSFAAGDIGLFASTYDKPGTRVLFDNLKVWPLTD